MMHVLEDYATLQESETRGLRNSAGKRQFSK